jgi:tetratricopeptide (TPR) repeat protein
MLSLTKCLDVAKKEKKGDYFSTDHIVFSKIPKGEMVNPYPDSLSKRKLWGVVGTFTDYMIRKMFRDGEVTDEANIVPENELLCETVLRIMPDLIGSAKEVNEMSLLTFSGQGDDWIDEHRENPWDESIPATFLISQLDSLYRAGKLSKFHGLSRKEHEIIRQYCGKILDWLRNEFGDCRNVILNPLFGHRDVCFADGDLVIDNTLLDIKTVQRPNREVNKSKNQLLGYAALAHYHILHPIETSPSIGNIESVGYLFPLFLSRYQVPINEFSSDSKTQFIEKLQKIQQEYKLPSVRPQVSEFVKMRIEMKKVMALMERGVTLANKELYDKAKIVLQRAVEIAPFYSPAIYHLSDVIHKTEGKEQAEKLLESALRKVPNTKAKDEVQRILQNLRSQ